MQDVDVLMECTACTTRTTLSLPDSNVLQPNVVLLRLCQQCARETLWQLACHAIPLERRSDAGNRIGTPVSAPRQKSPPDRDRRKQRRGRMKVVACVRHQGAEEVVKVVDLSRTGIRFQSSRQYCLGTWLRVAAPYLDGASSIFLSGRIVWRKAAGAGPQEYGLQYAA